MRYPYEHRKHILIHQIHIDWDIDNDKVCISFKNKEINNCLKDYAVDYKKDNILIEKTETNYESTLTRLMLINDKLR